MSDKKTCHHCGASMEEYRHGLNVGLVRALTKLAEHAGMIPGRLRDCGLTHTEHANFQKLGYLGLAEREQLRDGKGGWWRVTVKGATFLAGLGVEKYAVTYRGKVIRLEGPIIVAGEVIDGYRYRKDWAEQARDADLSDGQQPLFG